MTSLMFTPYDLSNVYSLWPHYNIIISSTLWAGGRRQGAEAWRHRRYISQIKYSRKEMNGQIYYLNVYYFVSKHDFVTKHFIISR